MRVVQVGSDRYIIGSGPCPQCGRRTGHRPGCPNEGRPTERDYNFTKALLQIRYSFLHEIHPFFEGCRWLEALLGASILLLLYATFAGDLGPNPGLSGWLCFVGILLVVGWACYFRVYKLKGGPEGISHPLPGKPHPMVHRALSLGSWLWALGFVVDRSVRLGLRINNFLAAAGGTLFILVVFGTPTVAFGLLIYFGIRKARRLKADRSTPGGQRASASEIAQQDILLNAALDEHDTPETALAKAQELLKASKAEHEPRRRQAIADRIGELSTRYDTPGIALVHARALVNVTAAERDPLRRLEVADRIGEILLHHDSPAIALARAQALVNATKAGLISVESPAMAELIEALRSRHDTPEIALAQAGALFNTAAIEPDSLTRAALAGRIGELLASHDTPEIALAAARAFVNASAIERDSLRCEALANRIGELLARHDTPDIALARAQALFNAAVDEPDPRRREQFADEMDALVARHDTYDIAFRLALTLEDLVADEPDPRRREELADRIGLLLDRHDTYEMALKRSYALLRATLQEPDPHRREAMGRRVRLLEARYGISLIGDDAVVAMLKLPRGRGAAAAANRKVTIPRVGY